MNQEEREFAIGVWIVRIILAFAAFGLMSLVSLIPGGIPFMIVVGIIAFLITNRKKDKETIEKTEE